MVKREFIVERQGRSFVLYAGLLDLAHGQGLRAIRTKIVQLPNDENGQTAVVSAEVETDHGLYSGIGDANPSNVARNMAPHLLRLAETRAKARAMRDAVNVGVTAFEELGDTTDDVESEAPPSFGHVLHEGNDLAPVFTGAATRPSVASAVATIAQVRAIYSIARDQHGLSEAETDQRSTALYGAAPAELTKKQASDFIGALKPATK